MWEELISNIVWSLDWQWLQSPLGHYNMIIGLSQTVTDKIHSVTNYANSCSVCNTSVVQWKESIKNSLYPAEHVTPIHFCDLSATSLCSASQVRRQRGTARIRPLLSAGCAAIDRYLPPAGSTTANLQQWVGLVAVGPCWDRQTNGQRDGRTPYRYIDPLCILCGQCHNMLMNTYYVRSDCDTSY